MDIQDIKSEIEVIKHTAGDYEIAHSREDKLHCDALRAIAEGADNASELAAEALKTLDIEFARYCA